jgi:signal transduction histidine kinase
LSIKHASPDDDDREGEMPDLPALCRTIVEGSPLPMAAVVGARHIVRYANPAFFRLLRKSSNDDVVGVSFAALVPEQECLSSLDRVYGTGEAETHTVALPSEAQPAHWTFAMWAILDGNKRSTGVMIQVAERTSFDQQAIEMNQELLLSGLRQHELTERAETLNSQLQAQMIQRKHMERALVSSEKLAVTARFALTMAHEINNPLEAITNLTYLLAPFQTSPEARSYIETIKQQVKNLTHIATQMLKFHRDSNQPTEFALSTLLREISDFYRPKALSQGVAIQQRIESEGIVVGFRSEMVQVITNLLLNALDATPPQGKITIHLYPAPPWMCESHAHSGYCISMADSGSGIELRDRVRIFEPFFTTKGDKGTGLGLWVSLGIVDRVGGSIRVWSTRRLGRSGTCFTVFLPVEQATFVLLRRR